MFLNVFLNEDEPHLEQTILPPNDRSETKEELPQLRQILFKFITHKISKESYVNYIPKNLCKE